MQGEIIIMIGLSGIQTGINPYLQNYSSSAMNLDKTSRVLAFPESLSSISPEKVASSQCQACSERKYVDGSNEGNVSFKSPGHISPEASKAVVSAHEQEHVSNARAEGTKENATLVSASVTLKAAICPECGTSYISGGTTTTQVKYEESNPYNQARKTIEGSFLKGQNVDLIA